MLPADNGTVNIASACSGNHGNRVGVIRISIDLNHFDSCYPMVILVSRMILNIFYLISYVFHCSFLCNQIMGVCIMPHHFMTSLVTLLHILCATS